MNNTDVTSPAAQHLEAVSEAQDALAAQYELPAGYRDQAKIAGLHQAINYGLKRAEVLSLEAAADALNGILCVLTPPVPTITSRAPEALERMEEWADEWELGDNDYTVSDFRGLIVEVRGTLLEGKATASQLEDLKRQWLALHGGA